MNQHIAEYRRRGWVFFSFRGIEYKANKKTPRGLPRGWQKLQEPRYSSGETCIAVVTGKVSGITVIDIDNVDSYDKIVQACPEVMGHYTVKSRKGYHLYYKYNSNFKEGTNLFKLPGIDIRSDGGMIFCPPSHYDVSDSEVFVYSVHVYTEDLTEVPEYLHTIYNGTSPSPHVDSISEVSEVSMREILSGLNESRFDNRDTWMRIGFVLSRYPYGEALFLEISKKSTKYNAERHATDWDSFRNSDDIPNPVGLGTLMMYLKEDSPKIFGKIIQQNKILKEINDITIKTESITNTEVIKISKQKIEMSCELSNAIYVLHNALRKSCKCAKFKGMCNSDGYSVECINCNFNYPETRIVISKERAPTVYNILTIREENVANKDTRQVALTIKEHTNVIFSKHDKMWYNYDIANGLYKEIDEDDVIMEIERIANELDDAKWKNWINQIGYKKNLIQELRTKVGVKALFDEKPHLIGFTNGVYNLNTGSFGPGKKDDYILRTCGVEYDPGTDTSLAETVLEGIFPSKDEREYAITKYALCLEGINREQGITFDYGYRARNGKSFLNERVAEAFGDYGGTFASTLLTDKMKAAGDANSALSGFYKKRFLYCTEPEAGLRINTNFVKALTGDKISARGLYAPKEILMKPTYHIFVCCNVLPNFDTYDEGIARRIGVIDFVTKFVTTPKKIYEKKNVNYTDDEKMVIARGLVHIFVKRYQELKKLNFEYNVPSSIQLLTKLYVDDNKDTIIDVLKESFECGGDSNYVRMSDVKRVLKNAGIKEKDVVTLRKIVEDAFPECEYIFDTYRNSVRVRRSFCKLVCK